MRCIVDGSLNFDTKIDTKGFSKGTNTIKGMANGLTGTLKKLSLALGGVFAVGKLVQVGKEAVNFASDIQEVQNVVDTAFGEMAYKMEQFAETSIETFGMSKLTAKEMGSTYMAMAKGMGQAADLASDKAIEMTGRLGDIMSFYNKTASEADTIGRAVYSGETEPLKQIGIIMTETNLKTYALSKGYSQLYTEMSAADKLLVRQEYFLEQTAMAAGDFVKTQDSWANQTRILSERWKEFLGILGTGLIQVLTPVVQFLNMAMSQLITFANTAGNVLSKVFGVQKSADAAAQSTAGIGSSAAEAGAGMSDMADEASAASKKINKSLSGFDDLNQITQNTADAASSIGSAEFAGLSMSASGDVQMDDQASPVVDAVMAKMEQFKAYLIGVFTPETQQSFLILGSSAAGLFSSFDAVFSDIWNLVILPFLLTLLTVGVPMMAEYAGEMASTLGVLLSEAQLIFNQIWADAVAPAMVLIMGTWQSGWMTIKDFWDKWGAPIFASVRTAIKKTGNTLQRIWDTILAPVWDTFMDVVDQLWDDHLQPFLANFLDLVGELINGALAIYNEFILPLVDWFTEFWGPRLAVVFETILAVAGDIMGGIIDLASGIITIFKGIIEFIVGVFTGDWRKALQGIADIFRGIWEGIEAVVNTVVNSIIHIINGMIRGICTGINTVIKAINSINFTIPDWVPGLGGSYIGFSLKEVSVPEIPKLATGAVIPPNSEFLAILGDQKHGTNIEAPLETIMDALRAVMKEQNLKVVFEVEGDPNGLFRVTQREAVKYTNRTGNPAFPM